MHPLSPNINVPTTNNLNTNINNNINPTENHNQTKSDMHTHTTQDKNNSIKPVTLPYLQDDLIRKYRSDNNDRIFNMHDLKLEDNIQDMNHKMHD